MTIEGVSPTNGIERRVEVTHTDDRVRLAISDRKLRSVLATATVTADGLMAVLTEQPKGPQAVEGVGSAKGLTIEIRRNEVLLEVGVVDVAVGLDDLMDALAAALPS